MRIIISPAKTMDAEAGGVAPKGRPVFMDEADVLRGKISQMSYEDVKALWACNDKLARLNFERFGSMDLEGQTVPALFSYDGIQYKYMASKVLETGDYEYLEESLRILSGFYGVLKPMDGIVPYRLEMQAALAVGDSKDLYEFWGEKIYNEVVDESRVIINLASKEYSKCVEKYLQPEDLFITVVFGELAGDKLPRGKAAGGEDAGIEAARCAWTGDEAGCVDWSSAKIVQKGTHAKMARGEMVHYMAKNKIHNPEEIKGFTGLGYRFVEELSREDRYVFVRRAVPT